MGYKDHGDNTLERPQVGKFCLWKHPKIEGRKPWTFPCKHTSLNNIHMCIVLWVMVTCMCVLL
jgi:hypothetical protein